jgi:hypothetical protein
VLFQLLGFLRAANGLRAPAFVYAGWFFCAALSASAASSRAGALRDHRLDSRTRFLREMPATIRADHPAIVPIAAAIRRITTNPLEQLAVVNDVTHLLVDYDDDERVYGYREFHATLDEMIARRREAGWVYLRDDCDGRAVFAAHLLAALGIPWRLEASYWLEHAWVTARVNGVDYDLLEFRPARPETKSLGYQLVGRHFTRPEHRPPYFAWRSAWRERTGCDLELGKRLGLLTLDATDRDLTERYATDWTQVQPLGRESPAEVRFVGSDSAGFPLGEPLRPIATVPMMVAKAESAPGSTTRIALRAADQ